MRIYIIHYDYNIGGKVIDAYTDKEKAEEIVKSKNGTGLRYGTYTVIEKELK